MKRLSTAISISMLLLIVGQSVGLAQSKEEGLRLFKQASKIHDAARTHEDLQQAVNKFEQALTIFENVGFRKGIGAVANNVGIVYKDRGQYDKAVTYFERALKIRRDLGDRRGEAQTLGNLAIVYKNRGQYDKAVPYYEKSLAIFRYLKDRLGEARILNNLGNVFEDWGQYDKAVSCHRKSLTIRSILKDRRGEAATFNNLGGIYRHWGQYEKAVSLYEKSLAISRDLKDRRVQGKTLNNLGIVYKNSGQYDKAVDYYKKSLTISGDLRDRRGEGQTLNNLASVYKNWGQYDKAVDNYEKSLAIKRVLKDRRGEGQTLNNLGIMYKNSGQYDKAVDIYKKSLTIFRDLKHPRGEGTILNNIGILYFAWGQYDKAISYFEKSLAIFRDIKVPRGEEAVLNGLGKLYMSCGQYNRAVSYYEKSLAISRDLKNPRAEGRILCNLGLVYSLQGDNRKARQKILQGLKIWEDIRVPTGWPKNILANLYMDDRNLVQAQPLVKEAGSRSTRGRLFLLKKEYEKAKGEYDQLLQSAEKNRNADNLFTAYTGLGLAYDGLQNNEKAAEYFRNAVAYTEELRTSLTREQREKFFDVRIKGFLRTAPYEGLARVLMRMNRHTEAFKVSEYSKARVFAEAMSRLYGVEGFDVPIEIIKEDGRINDRLASLKKTRQEAYERQDKQVIESLEPQISGLEAKRRAHVKMLRNKFPLFAATKYPEPLELWQTSLNGHEWVLSYDVTNSGVIVYLTKGKELVKGLFKPITRKEMDGLVRKFREPLEMKPGDSKRWKLSSFDLKTGKRLADILLGDILSELPKGAPVTIVPDDSLGVLPFEMLVLNEGGKVKQDKDILYISGAQFLGDRNPISYYQSVTALTLARTLGKSQKAGTRRLVMDDPVFNTKDPRVKLSDQKEGGHLRERTIIELMSIKSELGLTFSRLPLTGVLGKTVKDLDPARTDEYSGMEATKPVLFKKALDRYGSMVFATHGYFGKDLPGIQEPVLVLTLVGQPKGKDGFLRMSEVMGLKMNADIVALTACQTGLGLRISGEGTMGMGRAFQYAGARSVLMSMWSVAQSSSVKLVESFFRHLQTGKSKLEALRLARNQIREAGYDHPFFWAPFILVGEVD
jgi:tetratricopeptide (TPR) repeat protein